MFAKFVVAIFFLFKTTTSIFGASVASCPGGGKQGEQVTLGRYWYECQNGNLVPKGCFADDGSRMNVYDSYKVHGYTIRCEYDVDNRLMFRYKACLVNDIEYYPGQSWEEGKYWYVCTKNNDILTAELKGCMFDGYRYDIDATVQRDGYLYQCRKQSDSSCSMCPVACVENGQIYKLGETFESGRFLSMCTREQGALRVTKKIVGCVFAGNKLKDGDRYVVEDVSYECQVRENKAPEHKPVGCSDLQDGVRIDRPEGCEWAKGSYMMKCSTDGAGKLVPQAIKCFFKPGAFELTAGCFKMHDDTIVACRRNGYYDSSSSNLQLKTYPARMLKSVISNDGLRLC